MKPILSIQYVRALAVMCVVALHRLSGIYPVLMTSVGVDLFFVVSGFIMFTITERRESSPALFLWRRLIRIVPPYWCVTAIVLAITLVWPHFLWSVDISPMHVLTSFLFIPHKAGPEFSSRILPTVTQGWSLDVEMFFYLMVAASLFFPRRYQIWFLTGVFAVLTWIGMTWHPQNTIIDCYTNPRQLELVAGLWLGRFWEWKAFPGRRAGFVFMAVGFVSILAENAFNPLIDDLRPVAAAVLFVMGALCVEADGGIPEYAWLKLLGDASYSIYLIHAVVSHVIQLIPLPDWLSFVIIMPAAALAGIGVYLKLEKPMLARLHRIKLPRALAAA